MMGSPAQAQGGNLIIALDADTGKEAWRFHTIAQSGEPGDSWNDLPNEKRNGASVWTAGSYDPELKLAFFGVGQTYDTGPVLHRVDKPGVSNDGLFTDCTLAFNPDTGKLVWYFQHVHNDQWDLDWAFEQQIMRLPGDRRRQKDDRDLRENGNLRGPGRRHRKISLVPRHGHSERYRVD